MLETGGPVPEVGQRVATWFGEQTVLAVSPYTGRYQFRAVVRVTAPRTARGWLEVLA